MVTVYKRIFTNTKTLYFKHELINNMPYVVIEEFVDKIIIREPKLNDARIRRITGKNGFANIGFTPKYDLPAGKYEIKKVDENRFEFCY